MRTPISQREARRLRKRVETLEHEQSLRVRSWASEWPGRGVEICRTTGWTASDPIPTACRTARKLGHAVVIVMDAGDLRFIACELPK